MTTNSKAYTNAYYADNREARRKVIRDLRDSLKRELWRLKESDPCMDCNTYYPHYVMDYDHRPGTEKVCNPSKLPDCGSLKAMMKELTKCDLVCSNCHRIRTHARLVQQ